MSAAALVLAALLSVAADATADADATPCVPPERSEAESKGEPPATATAADPDPAPSRDDILDADGTVDAGRDAGGWLDRSHAALAKGFVDAVSWFDHFFGDGEHHEFEGNGSALLLRQELRLEGGPRAIPRVDARLDLRMPELGHRFERLHVVVYAQSVARDVANAIVSPRDGLAGPARGEAGDAAGGAAELRLDLVHALLSQADVGAGVHLQVLPGAYVRARLRSAFGVAPRTVARLTEMAFADTIQRLGVTAHGQLEHQLAPVTLLRADAVAGVAQTSRGWEWGSELSALHRLTPATALGASAGFAGHGQGGAAIDTWRVATKARAQVFRSWVFVEVEPEVAWPRDPLTGARPRVFAVSLRLDVQFSAEPDPTAPSPR
ncbi:MAG: hypothetical protein ACJ79L_09420 [Anaeromyxobacteraceae bacterium]